MSEHDAESPDADGTTSPTVGRRRGPRRAVRKGTEREDVPGVTEDERGGHGSNDERLQRDVPPHW